MLSLCCIFLFLSSMNNTIYATSPHNNPAALFTPEFKLPGLSVFSSYRSVSWMSDSNASASGSSPSRSLYSSYRRRPSRRSPRDATSIKELDKIKQMIETANSDNIGERCTDIMTTSWRLLNKHSKRYYDLHAVPAMTTMIDDMRMDGNLSMKHLDMLTHAALQHSNEQGPENYKHDLSMNSLRITPSMSALLNISDFLLLSLVDKKHSDTLTELIASCLYEMLIKQFDDEERQAMVVRYGLILFTNDALQRAKEQSVGYWFMPDRDSTHSSLALHDLLQQIPEISQPLLEANCIGDFLSNLEDIRKSPLKDMVDARMRRYHKNLFLRIYDCAAWLYQQNEMDQFTRLVQWIGSDVMYAQWSMHDNSPDSFLMSDLFDFLPAHNQTGINYFGNDLRKAIVMEETMICILNRARPNWIKMNVLEFGPGSLKRFLFDAQRRKSDPDTRSEMYAIWHPLSMEAESPRSPKTKYWHPLQASTESPPECGTTNQQKHRDKCTCCCIC